MPFARIDLVQGKSPEYRATVTDVVYNGIVGVLKAPEGDRFMIIGEHASDNFVYDPNFLDIKRSPDLIIIQVTSTVGNTKEQKVAFFRQMADELNRRLGVRREDVFISLVFVDREDWPPKATLWALQIRTKSASHQQYDVQSNVSITGLPLRCIHRGSKARTGSHFAKCELSSHWISTGRCYCAQGSRGWWGVSGLWNSGPNGILCTCSLARATEHTPGHRSAHCLVLGTHGFLA